MRIQKTALAFGVIALALVGCASAERASSTAGYSTDIEDQLLVKADMYGTSVELERGLYECEQKYPIPSDHPASAPLSECVAKVYEVAK